LIDKATEFFRAQEIPVFGIQMTTERPHRGDVETKICISPEKYTNLQEQGCLIGDHVNKVRYGYEVSSVTEALRKASEANGVVILELNPVKQTHFVEELEEKVGFSLTGWLGVETTVAQTTENMRERGETEETISARVKLQQEFVDAMEDNPFIKMVDNGPNNRENSAGDFIEILLSSIEGQ
jgi:hypothetical protein